MKLEMLPIVDHGWPVTSSIRATLCFENDLDRIGRSFGFTILIKHGPRILERESPLGPSEDDARRRV